MFRATVATICFAALAPCLACAADLTLSCQTVTTTENLVDGKPVDRSTTRSSLEITIHSTGYATILRNPENIVSDEPITMTPTKYFIAWTDRPSPYVTTISNRAIIDRQSGTYDSLFLGASNIKAGRGFSIHEVGPCIREVVGAPKF